MLDIRRLTFVVLSSALLFGTIYSVARHSYLDTSDPLVALGHVKHPLHDVSYFSRKTNVLNTVFIKRAWGWTTAAFVALWATAPRSISGPGLRSSSVSTRERIGKWLVATLVWLIFTSWFFGPAVFDRLTTFSGGECVVRLPSGRVHSIPLSYCHDKSYISPATHPEIFYIPPLVLDEELAADWRSKPRLMRGHDVSGHIFLLTMSLLFLADMVRPSLAIPSRTPSTAHSLALAATAVLMAIWVFAIFTTSVYFHTPFEKLTGYALGLFGFLITQLPFLRERIPEIHGD
ncbi:uncharacterized protein FOMMEDRAFT_108604 [Fomitiporia mediterranea MF3/22]|uniref:uncharacterized protein n=1 Tax=Fomitiporia mediterranea (strain MF3/22) TaxID=694068 RepID=UPI0004408BC8|nr:uncharacterized protein FOMMEDRAFT_108604 [Fomitiporia mediterranea MF3/22]EJD03384.1 hypothetical protein FOMMEDRAFT_108604 [Fomitiporia mediterranea MF3/22]